MNKYFEIKDDLQKYPDALFVVAWSGRGAGKTYSALRYCIENKKIFLYLKRTVEDIQFISQSDKTGQDVSPFAPLNRDFGYTYHIIPDKGKNGFCSVQDEEGHLIGYVLAVSAIYKVKGFELSDVDVIIFDEFIPQLTETRINRKEGESILELQATVSRDRINRGKRETDVWLLANATNPVSPISEALNLTDDIVEMAQRGIEYRWIPERYILLHNIQYTASMQHDSRIYQATKGTKWASMAFDNEFAFQDFSKVQKVNLKGAVCLAELLYNKQKWFLYQNQQGIYIFSKSANRFPVNKYSFDVDGDRRRFWYDYVRDVANAVNYNEAFFESYSMYYLIMNYQKLI